jgi:isopentenyl-diphosphate delta-isomerase
MNEEVVLVNENDDFLGTLDKNIAHIQGVLHRAISVIIINSNNEMLLQRRVSTKYHSASLWANAACTHPYINELTKDAATRRLKEEMGLETNLILRFILWKFKKQIYSFDLKRDGI